MNRAPPHSTRAPIAARPGQRTPGRPERRKFARIAASATITVMTVAQRCHGRMQDISLTGARINLSNQAIGVGRDVLLRWGPHEAFGHIAWVRASIAGIAFYQPITGKMLKATADGEVDIELEYFGHGLRHV